MKDAEKILVRIKTLDKLIQKENTGTPAKLALKLNISERCIYHYLAFMKNHFEAPLKWCEEKESYLYSKKGALLVSFVSEKR